MREAVSNSLQVESDNGLNRLRNENVCFNLLITARQYILCNNALSRLNYSRFLQPGILFSIPY